MFSFETSPYIYLRFFEPPELDLLDEVLVLLDFDDAEDLVDCVTLRLVLCCERLLLLTLGIDEEIVERLGGVLVVTLLVRLVELTDPVFPVELSSESERRDVTRRVELSSLFVGERVVRDRPISPSLPVTVLFEDRVVDRLVTVVVLL